jgi:hypothetical protein
MNGNETDGKKTQRDNTQKYFFRITLAIEIILGALLIALLISFMAGKPQLDIYSTVGIGLIILWIAIMVLYYSWAIYFYNVNLGLTDNDWRKIDESGNTDASVQTRTSNPEKGESLGLPAGSVRATIALSILVGGLALFIASLGRNNVLRDNQVSVDYFDFFKSAFLMMIAFYFGGKSLETLVSPKPKAASNSGLDPENTTDESLTGKM